MTQNSSGQARGPGTAIRATESERELGFLLGLFLRPAVLLSSEGCSEACAEDEEEVEVSVVDDLPSFLSEYLLSSYST